MKKQMLVVFTGSLELGGIETSLISLLDNIDYEKFDVDLFLYSHGGSLFKSINPHVNILPEYKELAYLRKSFKEKVLNGAWYSAFRRIIDKPKNGTLDYSWEKILNYVNPKFDKKYDLAISFFLPFHVVRNYVNADVKIGWIHTDYSTEKWSKEYLYDSFKGMDYLAAVSEGSKKAFDHILPEFSSNTIVVGNCLSANRIRQKADEKISNSIFDDKAVNLLSVGRFCEAKNFDNIPEICKKIREKGVNAKWYIIGFGSDEALIKAKITEQGMQEYVIVLGKRENPYPYMKNCDIYVQPSRYEGKCVSVCEAQILNKPVIITKYNTSSSQLKDGYDGVIVPMDNEGCAQGIVDVIKNKELQKKLIENTKTVDYTNSSELQKIYDLIK